jgi:beta-glucosidase
LPLVYLFAGGVSAAQRASEPNPAVVPEVQTAAWAQSWWMPRHEEKLTEAKEAEQVDVVFLGDSITHGWENRGKKTWEEFYGGRHALNLGFSGDRTEQVIWRLQQGEVAGISPKLAILMIGTNNAGHRQDKPEHTAAGIRAILQELGERLPKTKVLVLAIFPRGANPQDPLRKLNDATNRLVSEMADGQRVFYLDLADCFLEDDGNLPKAIMPDLLHPNEKGYAIWAEAMEPTVKRLLDD